MDGKREEGLRKGPWKAEEDEVLLKHVKKYGPRDWSSIRSKGLLERTGKSCRLRWVNKLRPNLKNGCKFSLEEERIVIELQTQFGNKWARIATYLPGRTDNDVKNFWSSRQKRLARILHTSSATTTSKSHKKKNKNDSSHYDSHLPTLKDPTFSVTSEAEAESSSKTQSVSSFCIDNSEIIKMVPFQDLVKPKLFSFEQDLLRPVLSPTHQSLYIDFQSHIPFPPPTPFHHQLDLTFPSETQQHLAGLNDFYSDIFAPMDAFKLRSVSQLPAETPLSALPNRYGNNARETIDNFVTTAGYFDDFPADIFDQMEEPFPNPSSSD